MKKIYLLDAWVMFLILIIQAFIEKNDTNGILSVVIFLLEIIWFYKLTIDLYKKLPSGHSMKIKKFYFHFFFPIIYIIIIYLTIGGYSIDFGSTERYGRLVLPIMLLHLFLVYCILYCGYFTSKTLVSVLEKDKNVDWSSYIGSIFGFFMLPIGIWFIQPKIKTIFNEKSTPSANSVRYPSV